MTTILVIEDEAFVREGIVELLELEDFDVVSATNGQRGAEIATTYVPDLIICDVMMPAFDGYSLLMTLRQHPKTATVPFIFLTARSTKSDFRQGMELGADDFLTKPFTRQELLGAVTAQLKKKNLLSQYAASASFSPQLSITSESNPSQILATDLRRALSQTSELQLYYQPQVALDSGKIVGAEALVRWFHPKRGLIAPTEFIPIAEATALITPLEEWILTDACQQASRWHRQGFTQLRMSVNLSGQQFYQPGLDAKVTRILQTTGFSPQHLELEITESVITPNEGSVVSTLACLRASGIQIAIDDFGTGYSSLSYLRQFPFDTLKIDRCFIHNLDQDLRNQIITSTITQMAHHLGLKVIAEGIETQAELDFLAQHQCDEIQGYWFSRPLPASEFEQLLISGKTLEITSSIASR